MRFKWFLGSGAKNTSRMFVLTLLLPAIFFWQMAHGVHHNLSKYIISQSKLVYPERTQSSSQSPKPEICLHPNNLEVRVNTCQFCINVMMYICSKEFFLADFKDFVQNDQIL